MKRFVSVLVLSLVSVNGFAANSSRPAMSNRIMTAPRYTASINQLDNISSAMNGVTVTNTSANSNGTEPTAVAVTERDVDMREAEKNACINNNIGVGNTFVWASRYSDTSNYAGMVEDVVNPQNNVCFVRVDLKSNDESRISVSDVKPRYFMWGEDIECGSWANKSELEKRILDAKKGNRVAGIVASTVGGAGLGVGIMEAFGNRLIGGPVMGQKSKEMEENKSMLLISQILTLKEKGQEEEYNKYVADLRTIKAACDAYSNNISGFDCVAYEDALKKFATAE